MKKLFKIFIALILSLSLVILVSCGDEPPEPPTPAGPPVNENSEEVPDAWQGPLVDY